MDLFLAVPHVEVLDPSWFREQVEKELSAALTFTRPFHVKLITEHSFHCNELDLEY